MQLGGAKRTILTQSSFFMTLVFSAVATFWTTKYYLNTTLVLKLDAEKYCTAMGGHLLQIESEPESECIYNSCFTAIVYHFLSIFINMEF